MKNKKINKKHFIRIAIVTSFLAIAGIAVMNWKHGAHEEPEIKFLVMQPWRDNIQIKKEYVAQIRAAQHIELRSMEKGYLQNIYVDEGQFVRKGQKMFQIMPMLLEAELKKAKAEYQLAKIEYDNTAILQKKNVVSVNELLLTKARLDKAKADLDVAQTHLEFSTIKAPFDGIMDRFHVRLGSLVDEGELLTNLSDNSKMWVYFNVSESDYLDYTEHKQTDENQSVELMLANGKIFSEVGKIDTIEADFNNEVGNVAFRATFANPEKVLRHGETGTVLLAKKYENVLLVPQKATFEVLDKKFVFVLDDKNQLHAQEVKIAAEIPHFFIISSGIKEEDKILLEGVGKVHEGEVIEAEMQDRETVIKNINLAVK